MLDWMLADFFLAGPVAIFASMYFSPNAAKKRLMKSLRSPDREKAIEDIRNAAWDMTHLSDLAWRIKKEGDGPGRFIFATGEGRSRYEGSLSFLSASRVVRLHDACVPARRSPRSLEALRRSQISADGRYPFLRAFH